MSPHVDEDEGEPSSRTDDLPLYEGELDDEEGVLPDPSTASGLAICMHVI
jgi:hypothetical protein